MGTPEPRSTYTVLGQPDPVGSGSPGLRSPHLQPAPSRTRRRGAKSPGPPARSGHDVPSEAAALLSRPPCARRQADGLGRAGPGRGGRTGRTGRGCGPRGMPGNTSQGRAREAPPPPGSKRRAPPPGPTPPGPRAQLQSTAGCWPPTGESVRRDCVLEASIRTTAWSLGSRQRTGPGQKLGIV